MITDPQRRVNVYDPDRSLLGTGVVCVNDYTYYAHAYFLQEATDVVSVGGLTLNNANFVAIDSQPDVRAASLTSLFK